MPEEKLLTILSPANSQKNHFRWKYCKAGEIKDENSEPVEIIGWLIKDVDSLSDNEKLVSAFETVDRSSYASVSNLCGIYNAEITEKLEEWNECSFIPKFLNRQASRDHVQFILFQCYNRAVAEPDKLNQYQPFSPQVYGETSFELISQMIDTVDVTAEDTFIDLGSGVGQVVLQVSACSNAKFCYGVEKADYPAYCASNLDAEFRHWMAFYGKSYRPYLLEKGDFLSRECHERIMSASVLFANNFAFGPEVDHQLKQKFANLREGARIISSKAFCPLNFRITDRNLGDIGSIMHVHCLNPLHDAVSWTDKPFSYYVHTIDRSLLERYFSRLKNPTVKDDMDVVRRDRKGRIISDQNLKDLPYVTNGVNQSRKATTHTACHQPQQSACRSRRSRSLSSVLHANSNSSGLLQRRANGMRHVRSTADTANIQATSTDAVAATFRQRCSASCKPPRRSHQHKVMQAAARSSPTTHYLESSSEVLPLHLGSLSLEQPGATATGGGGQVGQGTRSAPATFPTGSGRTSPSGSTPDEDTAAFPTGKQADYRRQSVRAVPPWSSSGNSSSSSSSSTSSSSSCLAASLPSSRVTRSPTRSSAGPSESLAPGTGSQHQSDEQGSDVCTSSHEVADSLRLTLRLSTEADYQVVVSENADADDNGDDDDATEDTSVANRRAVRKCRQSCHQETAIKADGGTASRLSTAAGGRRYSSLRRRPAGARQPSGDPVFRAAVPTTRRRGAKKQGKPGSRLRGAPPAPGSFSEGSQRRRNLDLLHDETVTQIRKRPTAVRRELMTEVGNNCPTIASFTCHYSPVELRSAEAMQQHAQLTSADPNIGHPQQPVPLALTQYLELTKRVLLDQFTAMRSPVYAEKVSAQLARERLRKTELLARLGQLETSINSLHADGTELLQRFMKHLGFLISTPAVFFSQARKLIKHHHMLESKISRYREEISQLTSANQDLVRCHQDEASRLISTITGQVSSSPSGDLHQMTSSSDLPPPMLVEQSSLGPAAPPLLTTEVVEAMPAPVPLPDTLFNRSSLTLSGSNAIPPPPQLTKVTCSPSRASGSGYSSGGFGSMSTDLPQAAAKTPHLLPASACRQPAVRPLLIIDRTTTTASSASFSTATTTLAAMTSSTPSPVYQPSCLPPPPPLLPMRHRQTLAQSTASLTTPATTAISASPHSSRLVDNNAKSMHASLQDLISDELNRLDSAESEPPTLCLAASCSSSFLPQLDFPQLGSVKATAGSLQQFMLPPRKRQWADQADRSPPGTGGHHSQKLARRPGMHQRRSSTPGGLGRGQDSSCSSFCNLSPPALSPGEPGLHLASISPTPSLAPSSQPSPQSGFKLQPFIYPPTSCCTSGIPRSNGSGSISSHQYSEPVTSHLFLHSPTTTALLSQNNGGGAGGSSSSGDLVTSNSGHHHLKEPLVKDPAAPPLLSKAVAYASPQTMVL